MAMSEEELHNNLFTSSTIQGLRRYLYYQGTLVFRTGTHKVSSVLVEKESEDRLDDDKEVAYFLVPSFQTLLRTSTVRWLA
jgi:hypothetical protein